MSHPARGEWIEITPVKEMASSFRSHPARGEWIEIHCAPCCCPESSTSHPARGEWIEIAQSTLSLTLTRSHPARGEWIEIHIARPIKAAHPRLTPRGVSGLKLEADARMCGIPRLTPRGVSGLKSFPPGCNPAAVPCLTPRGVSGLKYTQKSNQKNTDHVSPPEG